MAQKAGQAGRTRALRSASSRLLRQPTRASAPACATPTPAARAPTPSMPPAQAGSQTVTAVGSLPLHVPDQLSNQATLLGSVLALLGPAVVIERRFNAVDRRFERIEQRFEKVEASLEQLKEQSDAIYHSLLGVKPGEKDYGGTVVPEGRRGFYERVQALEDRSDASEP